MNTRQLEYFLAVARELNFTRAAESMYVSQTAVTQQIKALEEQLGVQLFERSNRRVELTAAGRVFQTEAAAIMNRIDTAVLRTREAANGFSGTLNIGFTVGIGNTAVSEQLRAFHECHPDILVRFSNAAPAMLGRQLREGELDLALMPLLYEKFYVGLAYQRVAGDCLGVVVPKDHPLAKKPAVTWKDLKDEPIIVAALGSDVANEESFVVDNLLQQGSQPNVVDYIEDVETIMFMVSCHVGVGVLPRYLALPEVPQRRISIVPIDDSASTFDIVAAWIADNDNPSLQLILPFMKEETGAEDTF